MADARQLVRTGLLYLQRAIELSRSTEESYLEQQQLSYVCDAIHSAKLALGVAKGDDEGPFVAAIEPVEKRE